MDVCRKTVSVVCLGGMMAWGGLSSAAIAEALTAVTASSAEPASAIAQIPETPSGYTVIHVSATAGNDAQGDGSQLRPYQTITQALRLAEANTLILLAGGIYSPESGETFPLQLRSGVTVQGMAGPNAADVVIHGHGTYRSASSGLRQVTLLGADNAGLANVTVSNPHAEGTGLWIETGSPIVLNSAFFRNGANGIYIAGGGAPVIRGNYFAENGQAGLVIAGPSTAKVEANIFENTGTGITVAPESSPEIVNNQISGNLDGLIVHAQARPKLQGNEIVHNRRNSIVDYAAWTTVPPVNQRPGAAQPPPPIAPSATQAAPALPAASITAPVLPAPSSSATSEAVAATPAVVAPPAAIAATPNPTTSQAVPPAESGSLVAAETEAVAAGVSPESATVPPTAIARAPARRPPTATFNELAEATLGDRLVSEIDNTAIALNQIDFRVVPAAASEAALADLDWVPLVATVQALASARAAEPAADEALVEDATAAIETDLFLPLPSTGEATLEAGAAAVASSPAAIDILVIPPPTAAIAKPEAAPPAANALPQTLPAALDAGDNLPAVPAVPAVPNTSPVTTTSSRLAVPNAAIPLGSGGSLPEVFTAGAAAALPGAGPPPPPSLAASLGLHYKVLVAASDPNIQAQVRAQVPDAFRRQLNGQSYLQAGAYPTLEEAQAMLNRLRQAGLPAQIEEIR